MQEPALAYTKTGLFLPVQPAALDAVGRGASLVRQRICANTRRESGRVLGNVYAWLASLAVAVMSNCPHCLQRMRSGRPSPHKVSKLDLTSHHSPRRIHFRGGD
jgi:hypothetical protein